MKWLIDVDGVITSNPQVWAYITYHLHKSINDNHITILTARNPKRRNETVDQLSRWGIYYDEIVAMPADLNRNLKTQAKWKIKMANKLEPDIWFDDHLKVYEQIGVNMDKVKKSIEMVTI